MKTAQDVLTAAGTLLSDEGFVRWTLPELVTWMNAGLGAIVLQKPSATATTVAFPLVSGTLQSLPSEYLSILRPVRNLRGTAADRQPRKIVTVVDDSAISSLNPGWHDSYSVPFKQQAKHFIFDEANPRSFYVYPGNDGTGSIELVVCAKPTVIAATTGSNPDEPASYPAVLPLDLTYYDALLDYIMYRAYSKDMQYAGSANRAVMHYQQFARSLGLKVNSDRNSSPNTKPGVAPSSTGIQQDS